MQLVNILQTAYNDLLAYLLYVGGPGTQLENYALAGLQSVANSVVATLGTLPSVPGLPSIPGL